MNVTDVSHAIQFFQTGFTILLGLALGEAFKQFVPDGDENIRWDRLASLFAFLFMIFPFFQGMSRYFYVTYLAHPPSHIGGVAGRLMFDGIMLMTEASIFFGMCRSLSPKHWVRFFGFLLLLLAVDAVWVGVSITYGAPTYPWLVLDGILAVVLIAILIICTRKWERPHRLLKGPVALLKKPLAPPVLCAVATLLTTVISYIWMSPFYFS